MNTLTSNAEIQGQHRPGQGMRRYHHLRHHAFHLRESKRRPEPESTSSKVVTKHLETAARIQNGQCFSNIISQVTEHLKP